MGWRFLSNVIDLKWKEGPKDEAGTPHENRFSEAVGKLGSIRDPSHVWIEEWIRSTKDCPICWHPLFNLSESEKNFIFIWKSMGLGHFDPTNQMITLTVITLLSHFNCIAQQNKILTYPSKCVNWIALRNLFPKKFWKHLYYAVTWQTFWNVIMNKYFCFCNSLYFNQQV